MMKKHIVWAFLVLLLAPTLLTAQSRRAPAKPSDAATAAFQQGQALEHQQKLMHAMVPYKTACDGGVLQACEKIRAYWAYIRGGDAQQRGADEEAARELAKACDGGLADACSSLGVQYSVGQGVTRDNAQAVALYQRACDMGGAQGCKRLGNNAGSGTSGSNATTFGAFDRFLGMVLAGDNTVIEFYSPDGGESLAIHRRHPIHGRIPNHRWVVRRTVQPGVFTIAESPAWFGNHTGQARLDGDGTLLLQFKTYGEASIFRWIASGTQVIEQHGHGSPSKIHYNMTHTPATPELLAAANAGLERDRADAQRRELERQERARQGREREASLNAARAERFAGDRAIYGALQEENRKVDARMAERTAAATAARPAAEGTTSGAGQQPGAMRTTEPGLPVNPAGAGGSQQSAPAQQRTAPSRASTDDDANHCVTMVETKLNDTFQGQTGAYVMNGCGRPVDVRICLMREKKDGTRGWNCGARMGVESQARASYGSYGATGEIFVDARLTGSTRPLALPPGYR